MQAHFVGYDGLPSDWYLRLVGEGAKMLRGQRSVTTVNSHQAVTMSKDACGQGIVFPYICVNSRVFAAEFPILQLQQEASYDGNSIRVERGTGTPVSR